MNPQFSIIVPCCNVARHAAEMLSSVKSQAGEWECLIVVEQSTDKTLETLKKLTAGDERFSIFTQERSGSPAAPRNTGLEHACGDYAVFLDGDDRLAENALLHLAERIAQHPGGDIYPCALREWQEGGNGRRTPVQVFDNFKGVQMLELSGCDAIQLFDRLDIHPLQMTQMLVCSRAFLNVHGLRFAPGLLHEDEEFFPRAFYRAAKVVPLHEVIYEFTRRDKSITNLHVTPEQRAHNTALMLKSLFKFHSQLTQSSDYDIDTARCWQRQWMWTLFKMACGKEAVKEMPGERRLEILRELFDDDFAAFDQLRNVARFSDRFAASVIKFAVRHGKIGLADACWKFIYFPNSPAK